MQQGMFYFNSAGKFCLAHVLKQLTRDVKSDIKILNFISDVTIKNTEWRSKDAMRRILSKLKEMSNDQ